ncbi:L-ascorbate oxidase homolog [Salvia hispanica]|uniref:L-ascorbate oxidase homolog n=1 Tax=Salvia hispanica TaxID=49212 RepID=UPI00200984DE|nr:L-ascorbate oxidase homolog [Salvia hispanica]
MGSCSRLIFAAFSLCLVVIATAEDPYLFFEWNVTYGPISPLGTEQQGILINGDFPGPEINCTSNNNIVVNVFNKLDEPFLLTWAGIQHRKNSWQDGTPGTMCPIPPGQNYTYKFQVKDQIGSYIYFPTTSLQRASGGMGMLKVHSRELIPVPFDKPAMEVAVLLGDWYNKDHKTLQRILDSGRSIGKPDGIQINGMSGRVGDPGDPLINMVADKTYRLRVCNVGMRLSINFRFQGHMMKLVEMEGSHTVQSTYESMDIHVGQCMSVLVTANQIPKDYYLVASSRFSKQTLTSVAAIRYATGKGFASPDLPPPPPENNNAVPWSINQFRSFKWNLTASAARPNPQGSYHYGKINITRTIRLANSRHVVDKKLRFAINGVSHVDPETPLKLAEYYGMADRVFKYDLVKDEPPTEANAPEVVVAPSVKNGTFRNFVEIIFENEENSVQTWHLDGYSFFAVAIEQGKWSPEKRSSYNLEDAVSRHTVQVYPNSWAAVMLTLDNAGMWNLRSTMRERAYLGQQLYFSIVSPEHSLRDEYNLPLTQQLCGIVKDKPNLALYT